MGNEKITPESFEKIEAAAKKVVSSKQNFDRIILDKQQALEMFGYNPFKKALILNKIPENGKATAYS